VQAYIALPIAALFFLELFWKRINAQAALVTLVGDFSAGILRLILEINKSSFSGIWYSIADLNFFYFAIFSLLMCIALVKLVSLFTTTPVLGQLIGLTYRTTFENDRQVSLSS
jgi:SSS family solute:Na+ symporter